MPAPKSALRMRITNALVFCTGRETPYRGFELIVAVHDKAANGIIDHVGFHLSERFSRAILS